MPLESLCGWTATDPSRITDNLLSHGLAESKHTQITNKKKAGDDLSPSLIWECCKHQNLKRGILIHNELQRRGLIHRNYSDALVAMYARCGDLKTAQALLDLHDSRNIITWTALIGCYARNGEGDRALECFEQMQGKGIVPNQVTYVNVLKACAETGALDKGTKVHDEISMRGLLDGGVVLGGALVDMYAKCGALDKSQSVLEKLPSRDAVSWSALITGYAENGKGQQALDCFEQMQNEGVFPDVVTYTGVLKACAAVGALDKGKKIHKELLQQGHSEHQVVIGGALVDMYAKCGALQQAQSALQKLPFRNVVCWTALIAGYVQNGDSQKALDCFDQMQDEGVAPNEVTFCCLLNLCSHLGLVDKGQELFDSMKAVHGLKPSLAVFTCMVDLLGRAGNLVKAVELIQGMPVSANSVLWRCLLGACRRWVDVVVGKWAFKQALKLDKCDDASYVLMANIYTAAGMHKEAREVVNMRVRNKALRLPVCSSRTDPNNKIHEFDPELEEIE